MRMHRLEEDRRPQRGRCRTQIGESLADELAGILDSSSRQSSGDDHQWRTDRRRYLARRHRCPRLRRRGDGECLHRWRRSTRGRGGLHLRCTRGDAACLEVDTERAEAHFGGEACVTAGYRAGMEHPL